MKIKSIIVGIVLVCGIATFSGCDDTTTNASESTSTSISARVTLSANQSIADTISSFIDFNSETFDTDNMHDNVTNPSRITVNTPGLYLLQGMARFAPFSGGFRDISIVLNGTTIAQSHLDCSYVSTFPIGVSTIYRLSQGDYIQLAVLQNTGASRDITTASNFSIVKLAD